MTPSSNTEKGVSNCGGRLVSPIIGRFCGYFTSGRSPLSNGRGTVSRANAFEPSAVAALSASPTPTRLIISRLSSMGFLRSCPVEAGHHRPCEPKCHIAKGQVNCCFQPVHRSPETTLRYHRRDAAKSCARKTPAAPGGRGFRSREPKFGSVVADVDGAQAIAVWGRDAASHVASVVAIATADEADAEAGVEGVVVEA